MRDKKKVWKMTGKRRKGCKEKWGKEKNDEKENLN